MAQKLFLAASALIVSAVAQQKGPYTPEVHPTLPSWKCTTAGGCVPVNSSVVLDSQYRYTHAVTGSNNCYSNGFNKTLCPDAATCGKNCALEGADYASYGIATKADALTLNLYVKKNGVLSLSSPRVYLLADENTYNMFNLLNQEISFDVDVSKVPCGVNGALYLSEMEAKGGANANNPAGAAYGTGYCDAQCPVNNFINGQVRLTLRLQF
jgi:cellulose 1,4-beta-cellobiosidase